MFELFESKFLERKPSLYYFVIQFFELLKVECKTVFHRKRRGRRKTDSSRRKDRLIQTRVGERLEQAIKAEAKRRRLTVSHLLRNVLEESFNLVDEVVDDVDTVVSDSLKLAHKVTTDVKRAARRSRRSHKYNRFDETPTDDEAVERENGVETDNRAPIDDTEAVIDLEPVGNEIGKNPLSHIYAWNKVILSQKALCSLCNSVIEKGEGGYVGLSDEPGHGRSWLCESCIDKL